MRLAVVLSAYNNAPVLRRCLQALARQSRLPDEVMLGDDGSRPEVLAAFREFISAFPRLVHVWHEDHGYTRAKIINRAVQQCTSDYVVMSDSDCLAQRHFVADHVALARPGHFVQGSRAQVRLLQVPGFAPTRLRIWRGVLCGHIYNRKAALRSVWLHRRQNPHHWNMPLGANLAFFRSDFIRVNGLDETFVGWGGEDVDLFNRFKEIGLAGIWPVSRCVLFHLDHPERPPNPEYRAKLAEYMSHKRLRCEVGYDKTAERPPLPRCTVLGTPS